LIANTTFRNPPRPFAGSVPLHDLIPHLSPQELGFVDALDKELAKIEEFYDARKKEMEVRTKMLEAQLIELNVHHRRFHEAQVKKKGWISVLFLANSPKFQESTLHGKKTPVTEDSPIDNPRSSLDSRHSTALDPDEYQAAKKKLKKSGH